jgi:hypothetical protein
MFAQSPAVEKIQNLISTPVWVPPEPVFPAAVRLFPFPTPHKRPYHSPKGLFQLEDDLEALLNDTISPLVLTRFVKILRTSWIAPILRPT